MQTIRRDLTASDHKYFFAINLYNSFDVIPDLFATLFRVAAILGYHNVFVSIYENGSTDQTKALLRIFDALTRSVGMRVMIRTSMRTRGAFSHRIEYLAEVRNSAFVPLHELRDTEGEFFDSIIFMNDILPCVDDLLELIWQSRRNNAGITCAADYMYHDDLQSPVFYDNWVARDINGTALENAPFEKVFHHQESALRWQQHLPIQVQSCWNGIAVLDPAPFYSPPHVRFRMARITEQECSASECSLICNDYWEAGYGRIMMVPRVKLAYDNVSLLHQPAPLSQRFYRKSLISFIQTVGILLLSEVMSAWVDSLMTPVRILRIGLGMAHTIGYSPKKKVSPQASCLDLHTVCLKYSLD